MSRPHRENSRRRARTPALGALALAAAVLAATPAGAQRKPAPAADPSQAYERCMDLAQTQPSQAYTFATQLRNAGGGYAAEHCEAAALLNLKQYDEAAKRFHEVGAGATAADVGLRAEAYDQAAQAWLMAQKPQSARAEFDAALKLQPKAISLLLGRAQAEGLAHDFWAALDDLNAVLDMDPKRVEALVLRAAAYRQVEAGDLAMDDIARAISLSPQFPDAYLERGTLMAMKGDYAGARKDWNKARELAPGSFVAELAQRNIAKLDDLSAKVPTAAPKPARPAQPPAKP